jgi:AraC-like DNA-binding protein
MTGPLLHRPASAVVAGHVDFFGYWASARVTDPQVDRSRALPRGAATVVVDLSGRTDIGLFAADGQTMLPVPPAFIVGPGRASYVTQIDPAHTVMTIHFRPAGALAFVGFPLGELEDACVGLTDLLGVRAALLHERLIETRSRAGRLAILEAFVLDRLQEHAGRLHPDVAWVLRTAERDPSTRVSTVHDSTRLSPKRLNAVFRSEVGLSPKAYFRVRRLQAALRALDNATAGAAIAADLGYFDQAHLVREFKSFTTMTPTQYAKRRSSMPGHVQLGAP